MKKLLLAILTVVLCGFLSVETITPINAQSSSATISAKKSTKEKKKKKKKKKKSKKSKKKSSKKKKKSKKSSIDTSTPEGKIAKIIQDDFSRNIEDPKIEFDGTNTYYVTYNYDDLGFMTTTHISQVVSDYVDICRSAYENDDINSIAFNVTTSMTDGTKPVVLMFCSNKDTFMQTDLTDFMVSDYWGTFSNACTNAWISPNIQDKVDTSKITYIN